MSEKSLEVGVKVVNARLRGEVQPPVDEVGGEEMVEFLEVCPGPVDKPLLWRARLRLQCEVNPVALLAPVVRGVQRDHPAAGGTAGVTGGDVGRATAGRTQQQGQLPHLQFHLQKKA